MIVDLFSHKIHSSGNEWPDKLSELAAIVGEFDGELFDRDEFENRLRQISPRSSYLLTGKGGRVRSQFRDEISAYPAYLGLYYLELSQSGWVVKVTETTKRFLLLEEPDVASFLRLQLSLFQYPNAMGAVYRGFTSKLHIQANARDRALEYISQGIHLSPLRLIAVALMADASLRDCNLHQASISFDEVFGLANYPQVNRQALADQERVEAALYAIRNGELPVPERYESRFHILRHTEIFLLDRSTISLRETLNGPDADQLVSQLGAICEIENQFTGFDECTSGENLIEVVASGEWGRYFDGVRVLPSHIVQTLTSDNALDTPISSITDAEGEVASGASARISRYPFRTRGNTPLRYEPFNRRREMQDPELTRIRRQRRNLAHKVLVDKMDVWLRVIGAEPKENEHIDLLAHIPDDGSFIFEMKSGGTSILDQIRKGLSQLYEYRYRYRDNIEDEEISLCLVLPEDPQNLPWVTDYLCEDRKVNLCWFDASGSLKWPDACADRLQILSHPDP